MKILFLTITLNKKEKGFREHKMSKQYKYRFADGEVSCVDVSDELYAILMRSDLKLKDGGRGRHTIKTVKTNRDGTKIRTSMSIRIVGLKTAIEKKLEDVPLVNPYYQLAMKEQKLDMEIARQSLKEEDDILLSEILKEVPLSALAKKYNMKRDLLRAWVDEVLTHWCFEIYSNPSLRYMMCK